MLHALAQEINAGSTGQVQVLSIGGLQGDAHHDAQSFSDDMQNHITAIKDLNDTVFSGEFEI